MTICSQKYQNDNCTFQKQNRIERRESDKTTADAVVTFISF